jgi:hypothetical protein
VTEVEEVAESNGGMNTPPPTIDAAEEKRREKARLAARKRARARREEAKRARARLEQEAEWDAYSVAFLRRQITLGWLVIFMSLAGIFIALAIVFATVDSLGVNPREKTIAVTAFSIIAVVLIAWGFAAPVMMRARRELRTRERAARERAKQASEELADATSLAELLKANRKQIDAYDELARAQSKEAFRNSQVAISIGMSALVVGGLVAVVVPNTTAKITTASLTAIAGALAGYIGKTFLRVYERTQQQLTFFFQQPLINSYVLSAERLIDAHVVEKDREVSRIIDRILAVLVRLPDSWGDWTARDTGRSRGRGRGDANGKASAPQTEPNEGA